MSSFGTFFLPGPTEVRPEVLQAMTRPLIGHRTAELTELLAAADPPLRAIFRTSRPVYVVTASATGLMEAAVRCGVRKRALSLVNGAFSGRFRELVAACDREVETYEVDWGEAHDPTEVERRLRAGGIDAVTVVHSETSTGVLNPVADIAEAVRNAEHATGEEIHILVDGVSSVGGVLVEAEVWKLDFLLTGAQKALALPPGLAFGTASERLLERGKTLPARGRYLDLIEIDQYWKGNQTPQTPAISLIYALDEQLRHISAEGIEARAARHNAMAKLCWQWVQEMGARCGISVLAPVGYRSPTVSALVMPADRTVASVVAGMRERGYAVSPGYGKLREKTVRIGHMGDHTVSEVEALLEQLQQLFDR